MFISRGDWTNRKLRTVLWRCGLSRGQAPFPDYAQGNPGLEIVAYDENGGSMEIDLSGMDGTLKARWYNPRTGSYAEEQSVSGGQPRSFQAPSTGEDWVLHIYRSN